MDKENVIYICVCVSMYTNTETHTNVHAMEYYLATKKKILSFATAEVDFEGIMLSE